MADAHRNFAVSNVVTAPSPATSGTSLSITTGHGAARFAHTPPYNAVVCPANTDPTPANAEIVRVTGRTGDTLSITRAQEGSTARAIVAGDRFYAALTAKSLTDIEAGVALTGSGTPEGSVVAGLGALYTDTAIVGKSYVKRQDAGLAFGWTAHATEDRGGVDAFYVAGSGWGNDSANGKSWGSAFATIAQALSVVASGGTIYLAGPFTETVTLTKKVHFKGFKNATIKAPSAAANCIVMSNANAASSTFEDITTEGATGNWTGVGWDVQAPYVRLVRCGHVNPAGVNVSSTAGGIGFRLTGTEGVSVENFVAQRCRIGMEFVGGTSNGASVSFFKDYKAQQCFDYVIKFSPGANLQGGGGHTFIHCKSVGSGDLVTVGDPVVDLGDPADGAPYGSNLFIHCDWDENLTGVTIASQNNTFINCTSAPSCQWTVSGDDNHFIRHTILGANMTVTGSRNIFDNLRSPEPGVVDNGIQTIFRNLRTPAQVTKGRTTRFDGAFAPAYYPSALTVGTAGAAAAPPTTPAKWVSVHDPASGQNLMVPAYLPAANPVLDGFNRADAASSLGSADSGQAWTAHVGTWGVLSNRGYTTGGGNTVATLDAGIADGIVEFDYVVATIGNVGLAFRYTDGNNYWYTRQGPSDGSLFKNVAGTRSNMGGIGTLAVGDHVRVVLSGTKITVFVNGVVKLTVTDSAHSTATRHGLYADFDQNNGRFDNFRVTA